MNTRKRDPESTKTAILDTAEDLFLENGVAKVSLSELARAAGVTKSLIHHHFGSKEQLWVAVKQRFFAEYTEGQRAMLENSQPSMELLRNSLIGYFQYLLRKPNFARMNCMMMLEGDDSCETMFKEIIQNGTIAIRQAQKRGDFRSDISADHILISGLSLVENWFVGRDRFIASHYEHLSDEEKQARDMDTEYMNDMLSIYLEGITPRN